MAKQNIMVLGAGKVGALVAALLAARPKTHVYLCDIQQDPEYIPQKNLTYALLDAANEEALSKFVAENNVCALVSALPYFCNLSVARVAHAHHAHYFDLTEDTQVAAEIRKLAGDAKTAFVPQCGLAPGFISIVANHLMQNFDKVDKVKMRVGALPMNPSNVLKYSLTWSTDGLINEYGNVCYGIEGGKLVELLPLEGHETITLDGVQYEAFNTSGGLGTLPETYEGKVKTMNYKTLRYPGHCENIRLLMHELKLNDDRETLKRMFENALPKTSQDVVLIYVHVVGYRDSQLLEETYVKKIYPQEIFGKMWSAIQVSTAAGICAVVDLVMMRPEEYRGFIRQEQFSLDDFLKNKFGRYYANTHRAG